VHKLFVCKKFTHQNPKISCLMNTQSETNFQWKNKINLKLHACCTHIRKPWNQLELGTLATKKNQHRTRSKNQKIEKHLQNVVESWEFKSDEHIQNAIDNQNT
jgi:hypothetical protein